MKALFHFRLGFLKIIIQKNFIKCLNNNNMYQYQLYSNGINLEIIINTNSLNEGYKQVTEIFGNAFKNVALIKI
jgi:hypothetical protein